MKNKDSTDKIQKKDLIDIYILFVVIFIGFFSLILLTIIKNIFQL